MIVTATAKRYARALFELARDKNNLNDVLNEFDGFLSLLDENSGLQQLLKLPNVVQREQSLMAFLKSHYSDIFFNFLQLVLKNNRYVLLRQILFEFQHLNDAFNNRVRAEVISASPLADTTILDLTQLLKDYFNAEIVMEKKIDISLIGGFIINVNGQVFDASVLTKFKKMKIYLTKN
jgi:F-type H+-transporting ATPase subunit delta